MSTWCHSSCPGCHKPVEVRKEVDEDGVQVTSLFDFIWDGEWSRNVPHTCPDGRPDWIALKHPEG